MLTDDEMLARVQRRAGTIRRRRRVLTSGCAAVLVTVLLGGAVASAGSDGDGRVSTADDPGGTSTTEPEDDPRATTTTEADDDADDDADEEATTTTSTTVPASSTAPQGTAPDGPQEGSGSDHDGPPPSTAPTTPPSTGPNPTEAVSPPFVPTPTPTATVTGSRFYEGLQIDVVATYRTELRTPADRQVDLVIRVRDDHGSHPGGVVAWDHRLGVEPPPETDFGSPKRGYECPPAVSHYDPDAGPVDQTFHASVTYEVGGEVVIDVSAGTSWCTLDSTSHAAYVRVPVP